VIKVIMNYFSQSLWTGVLLLLIGCATSNSTIRQLESQTQENRRLLQMEKEQSRKELNTRARLQNQIEGKKLQLAVAQNQSTGSSGDSTERAEEVKRLNREIAALQQALLEAAE
jgi:altronate dehydratase